MWAPLVECPPEMGTLRFLSGSRRAGPLGRYGTRDGGGARLAIEQANPGVFEQFELSAPLALRVGDVTIHDGLTLHAAPANTTDSARWVYSTVWFPADARGQRRVQLGDRRAGVADRRAVRRRAVPGGHGQADRPRSRDIAHHGLVTAVVVACRREADDARVASLGSSRLVDGAIDGQVDGYVPKGGSDGSSSRFGFSSTRLVGVAVAASLLMAACGDDDDRAARAQRRDRHRPPRRWSRRRPGPRSWSRRRARRGPGLDGCGVVR